MNSQTQNDCFEWWEAKKESLINGEVELTQELFISSIDTLFLMYQLIGDSIHQESKQYKYLDLVNELYRELETEKRKVVSIRYREESLLERRKSHLKTIKKLKEEIKRLKA